MSYQSPTLVYLEDYISVTVTSRQMQTRVIAHVSGIDPRPTLDQQVHDVRATLLSCPMQETKPVIISGK